MPKCKPQLHAWRSGQSTTWTMHSPKHGRSYAWMRYLLENQHPSTVIVTSLSSTARRTKYVWRLWSQSWAHLVQIYKPASEMRLRTKIPQGKRIRPKHILFWMSTQTCEDLERTSSCQWHGEHAGTESEPGPLLSAINGSSKYSSTCSPNVKLLSKCYVLFH